MRILITRHGESEGNKLGVIQGHLDMKLTELGKRQARKLAERLKDEKIDLIVSSDLTRAADTAREIARFHDCEVLFDERLRERGFGKFEGRNKVDIGIPEGVKVFEFLKEEDIEKNPEFMKRAQEVTEDVLKRDRESVLLVGHMGICKFVIAALLGKEINGLNFSLKNTSLSIFEKNNDCINEILLNCTRHLDEN